METLLEEVTEYPEVYTPRGGHMPFPPSDCTNLEKSFIDTESGMRWLDNYFCNSEKCTKSPCSRRKAFCHKNYKEWWDESNRLASMKVRFE